MNPSSASSLGSGASPPAYEVLFSGALNKAGDDNSRWKRRFFQLVLPMPALSGTASTRARLHYFENEKDAAKGKPPRGELGIQDVMGLAAFGRANASGVLDAALQSCIALTGEHVQEGPTRLMVWGRDRLWRLAEMSPESNVVGEMIRALDRVRLIPKVAVRAVGWMRTQGTLSWNRRYAMLLSSGDLLLFRDVSLDHLRRRIDLARAIDIRPLQPLAPAGSVLEKRVLRILAYSTGAAHSWEAEIASEGFELVGIRVRHPDIPDKKGYVMCVESSSGDDTLAHYALFRRWIVQLQLSAAEARLSGFAMRELATSAQGGSLQSDSNEDLLERKLLQVVNTAAHQHASREGALAVAVPYLIRIGVFPETWRGSLWYVLSGGASLKRTLGTTYSALIPRDDPSVIDAKSRISAALARLDSTLVDLGTSIDVLLSHAGEDMVFWTLASLAAIVSVQTSSTSSSLQGFFHPGLGSYVECRVILDMLGLTCPSVVAHITAYDLLSVLQQRCLNFMTRCRLPQVWDGISVWGRDAMSYGVVSLLADQRAQILESFNEEDLARAIDAALTSPNAKIGWDKFDLKMVEQVRRAQMSSISETIRDHLGFIASWRYLLEEARTLGRRTLQELNRLFRYEDDSEQSDEQMLHLEVLKLIKTVTLGLQVAVRVESALERETTGMTSAKTVGRDVIDGKTDLTVADDLTPLMEAVHLILQRLSWISLHIGWTNWLTANTAAERLCHFVPRAYVSRVSTLQIGSPITNDTSPSYASPPLNLPTPPGSSLQSAASMLLTATSQASHQPVSDESPHQDTSSLKSLAIGLGKRLFQQRFNAPSDGTNSSTTPTMTTVRDSIQVAGMTSLLPPAVGASSFPSSAFDRPPRTPVLSFELMTPLLGRYKGGYVGLCDRAGRQIDAILVRDGQLKDIHLMHSLDTLDVMLRITSHADHLVRWMINKDPLVPLHEIPLHLRHLFLSKQVNFDIASSKALSESLKTLCLRATLSPSI